MYFIIQFLLCIQKSPFDDFKKAITHCLETANTSKKEQLATLLTWDFQSFRKIKFLAV